MATSPTADREEVDPISWYLRPSLSSIARWPLALYYLGGLAYALSFAAAVTIDLIRWNLPLWLLLGWHLPLLGIASPALAYWLPFALTADIWQSPRRKSCAGIGVNVILTAAMLPLSSLAFTLAIGVISAALERGLGVQLRATLAVVTFFSRLGLWTSLL